MPGHCPGPAACPCVDDRPACRDCGERYSVSRMHSQAADDSFICEDCAETAATVDDSAEPYFERAARELRGMP
jgi:hypothetical protein